MWLDWTGSLQSTVTVVISEGRLIFALVLALPQPVLIFWGGATQSLWPGQCKPAPAGGGAHHPAMMCLRHHPHRPQGVVVAKVN